MFKSIAVSDKETLKELNDLYQNGWVFVDSCAMPPAAGGKAYAAFSGCCLVTLKKET